MDTDKLLKLSSAFSPRVPIDSRSLFCGRINQISQLMEIVGERGLHGILFGERGVGKTSLVFILNELLNEVIGKSFVLHIPCNTVPSFNEIARHVANKLTFFRRTKRVGFSSNDTVEQIDLSSMLSDEPTVAEVGEILALLKPPAVIVLDEFDRIRNSDDRTKIANLVKALSESRQV
jgi:Cdc6-like AAA superfamily ATPase